MRARRGRARRISGNARGNHAVVPLPCLSLRAACKDDELKKVEDAVSKGAELNYQNEKGHSAAHVAAAFGALACIRYLHKNGADFTLINNMKMTPLKAAQHIGEENAAKLIEALLAGLSGEGIGDDEEDEEEAAVPPPAAKAADEGPEVVEETPSAKPAADAAPPPTAAVGA